MKISYIAPVKSECRKKHNIIRSLQFFMACAFINVSTYAKTIDDIEAGVQSSGEAVFRILKSVAYWICAIVCLYEIVMKIKDGDSRSAWGILIKYTIIFLPVFLIKIFLNWIGVMFG